MAYGNYTNPYLNSGNGQYVSPYGNAGSYQGQFAMQPQQPQTQQPVQQYQPIQPQVQYPQQTIYEMPIQAVKFVTEDEAKAYIVLPNQRVLLIDRVNGVAYDKSADSLGQSKSKMYRFTDPDQTKNEIKAIPNIELEQYAKREELSTFITQDMLNEFKQEMLTKFDDLKKTVIEKYLNTGIGTEKIKSQEAHNGKQ